MPSSKFTVGFIVAILWAVPNNAKSSEVESPDRQQAEKYLSLIENRLATDIEDFRSIHDPINLEERFQKAFVQLEAGDEIRIKALAIARQYASVREQQIGRPSRDAHHTQRSAFDRRAHARLHFSWQTLRNANILHNDMGIEEAVAILGLPTRNNKLWVVWYYNSQMHVNPRFSAEKSNDRISNIKISND